MKKIYFIKVVFALMLGLFSLTNVNAFHVNPSFLEDTETVDIVQIPAFDGDGAKAQRYLADVGGVVTFITEQNETSQWYKIPAGGVSNGTEDVQAYYFRNVATGKYLRVDDDALAKMIKDRDGDWPIAQPTTAANDKSLGFKWFERPANWPWGIFLSNAAGIDLTARENNQIFSLTSITIMKNEGEEFFGVNFPDAAVGGFAGGGGNAWTAVKIPVVLQSEVANPELVTFLQNTATVDIVQIPAFDGDGAKTQRYLADAGDVVTFITEQNETSQWYKIPAGGVSNGTEDVQAYYFKNVATGKYLRVDDDALAKLIKERDGDGDWPIAQPTTSAINDESLGFKWFERPANWPWGIFLSNAAGIDLTARENNQIFSLTSITIMKNEGEEFFGVNFPDAAVGGFAGGGGNAWTAVKIPVVLESEVANPDFFPENPAKVDVVQIPAFDGDGAKTQRYLADAGDVVTFITEQNETSQWYKIPAGSVSNGTGNVQAYYFKNVATGKYLRVDDDALAKLITERDKDADWPIAQPTTSATNDKSLGFKWFERPANWPWGIFLSNAEGIDLTAREGNQIFSLTSITIMKNEGEEFFGVNFPDAAVGGFAGGGGNAWTAVKIPVVLKSGVANPDYDGPAEGLTYDIKELNFFASDNGEDPDASSYDPTTHTITYNDAWRRAGWNFEPQGGLDASQYSKVYLKFDATTLAGEGEKPEDIKIQFDVVYMDGSQELTSGGGYGGGNEYRANVTEAWWTLTNAKTQKIKLITLKSQAPGKVVLTDAYFSKSTGAVDLIVTNVRWEPENPKSGDQVVFFATIKNDGDIASPADTKHGVVFQVNNIGVTWCDGFRGPIEPGKEVEVSSTMEHSSGSLWTCGNNATYNITAWVNDTKDVIESDYSNNYSETKVMDANATGIDEVVVNKGIVYYANETLYVLNYPSSAVLTVYNLLGETVFGYQPVSEKMNANLSSGIYLIKVQYDGKSFVHKVIVK